VPFQPDWYLQEALRELNELVVDLNAYQLPALTPQLDELLQGQLDEIKARATTLLLEIGPQQGEVVETQ
jgi:hypothetical protein